MTIDWRIAVGVMLLSVTVSAAHAEEESNPGALAIVSSAKNTVEIDAAGQFRRIDGDLRIR